MAQLWFVNRTVNQTVAYREDSANWRSSDYWATGPETLARGAGDCEDFAIAKMQILRSAGFPADDLFLVIGNDLAAGSPHAVLIARIGGDFWVLDNLHNEVRPADSYSHFRPLLSFNTNGRWLHGYRPGDRRAHHSVSGGGRLASIIAAQNSTRAF